MDRKNQVNETQRVYEYFMKNYSLVFTLKLVNLSESAAVTDLDGGVARRAVAALSSIVGTVLTSKGLLDLAINMGMQVLQPSKIISLFEKQAMRDKLAAFSSLTEKEIEDLLLKSGTEIFRVYEYSFMNANDRDNNQVRGRDKLIIDAVNRCLNHVGQENERARKEHNSRAEPTVEMLLRGVIEGQSDSVSIKDVFSHRGFDVFMGRDGEPKRQTTSSEVFSAPGLIAVDREGKIKFFNRSAGDNKHEYRFATLKGDAKGMKQEVDSNFLRSDLAKSYESHNFIYPRYPELIQSHESIFKSGSNERAADLKASQKVVNDYLNEDKLLNLESSLRYLLPDEIRTKMKSLDDIQTQLEFLQTCYERSGTDFEVAFPESFVRFQNSIGSELDEKLDSLPDRDRKRLNLDELKKIVIGRLVAIKDMQSFVSVIVQDVIANVYRNSVQQNVDEIAIKIRMDKDLEQKINELDRIKSSKEETLGKLEEEFETAKAAAEVHDPIHLDRIQEDLEDARMSIEIIEKTREETLREHEIGEFKKTFDEMGSEDHERKSRERLEVARHHVIAGTK